MSVCLKLLADVAVFRFRRLEMSNIFDALTVMIVLRLPWPEVILRTGFVLLLNLLSVLINDYYDVQADLLSPGRDLAKTRFLAVHMKHAPVAQIAVAAFLFGVGAMHSWGLVLALLVGAGSFWLYSARLKGVPFADIAAIAVWGPSMVLAAFPLDREMGWHLLGQIVAFAACFHAIQILRDRATASWNRMRIVMGLAWLAMLSVIHLHGHSTSGLLLEVPVDAVLGGPS